MGRAGRDEIWHYGLRNSWRFDFDRATGTWRSATWGQVNYEEVDYVAREREALNFGWRSFEGFHPYAGCNPPGHVLPAFEYCPAAGAAR